jgi:hypothetical protein
MLRWANLPVLAQNSLPQKSVNTHTHKIKLHVTTCPVSDRNNHREVNLHKTLSRKENDDTRRYINKALCMPISHFHDHRCSLPSATHSYNLRQTPPVLTHLAFLVTCSFKIQWKPLIMITLSPALFDNNNRLITLSGGYKNLHYLTQFIVTTFYVLKKHLF